MGVDKEISKHWSSVLTGAESRGCHRCYISEEKKLHSLPAPTDLGDDYTEALTFYLPTPLG